MGLFVTLLLATKQYFLVTLSETGTVSRERYFDQGHAGGRIRYQYEPYVLLLIIHSHILGASMRCDASIRIREAQTVHTNNSTRIAITSVENCFGSDIVALPLN